MNLALRLLPGSYAICRLDPGGSAPAWAMAGSFWCLLRSDDELSLVCDASQVPPQVRREEPWRVLKIAGPLDFSLVGLLSTLTTTLAAAGIPLFALSSFDTDYLLVRAEHLERAVTALRAAGHGVEAG